MRLLLSLLLTCSTLFVFSQVSTSSAKFLGASGVYMSANMGGWLPNGNAKLLGNHPAIGFEFGYKGKHLLISFASDLRILDAPNTYTMFSSTIDNFSIITDSYRGGYYGIEVGYGVVLQEKLQMQLVGTAGFDGFTVKDMVSDNSFDTVNAFSYGGGIRAVYHLSEMAFLSAQSTYNIFNYDTNGGTDLSGNAINFKIGIGSMFSLD